MDPRSIARGVLESVDDNQIVLTIPGTAYRLHLVPTVPAKKIKTPVGKRIKGRVEARALRMFGAHGGGQFIEPINGAPRIVAGTVLAVDEGAGTVLVDVSVPITVTVKPGQDLSICEEGGLVNFYVESGTTFTPLEG